MTGKKKVEKVLDRTTIIWFLLLKRRKGKPSPVDAYYNRTPTKPQFAKHLLVTSAVVTEQSLLMLEFVKFIPSFVFIIKMRQT